MDARCTEANSRNRTNGAQACKVCFFKSEKGRHNVANCHLACEDCGLRGREGVTGRAPRQGVKLIRTTPAKTHFVLTKGARARYNRTGIADTPGLHRAEEDHHEDCRLVLWVRACDYVECVNMIRTLEEKAERGGLEHVDRHNLALAKASMQRHRARSVIDVSPALLILTPNPNPNPNWLGWLRYLPETRARRHPSTTQATRTTP